MKYIIYDFNGTVFDDVDICVECENETIKHFNLNREPLTKEEYLNIFTFPVKEYYHRVGFDFIEHSYEEIGDYWFKLYSKKQANCKVFDGVEEMLIKSHELGYKNILLSVSSLEELKKQIKQFGIDKYFDEVLGIDNIYANSKVDIGLKWIKDKDPSDCLMIGDSLHDKDVADAMKVKCILVSRGHQAKDILLKNTDLVVDDIREIDLCV